MKIKNTGYCALTGEFGVFSKSHIIPKAFVRRVTDLKFVIEDDRGFLRRDLDACRDDHLMTAKGEKITADYDDAAIRLFRKHRLTYATRRNKDTLEIEDTGLVPYTIIDLQTKDINYIKLFALSLLWRAAASKREEFANVTLEADEQEELRLAVASYDAKDPSFFPCLFMVFDHATELVKINPYMVQPQTDEFYRFFLDGVVCYISKKSRLPDGSNFGLWKVGASSDLHILVLPSEGSFQDRVGREGVLRLFEKFGDPWENSRGADEIRRRVQNDQTSD